MLSLTFIVIMVAVIFAVDIGARWWRETAWKRRWRKRGEDDD